MNKENEMTPRYAKLLFVITILSLLLMSACSPTPSTAPAPTAANTAEATQPTTKTVKAAVLLEGPLADTGWNTSSWEALLELEKKYGWEVSYQDNINTDNMIDLLRGYGQRNFDLVFGPGWLWAEPMGQIAPEFPNTTWVNINQNVSGPSNFSSNGWITGEGGYLLGLLAAQMTNTKKIAQIGGTESPLIFYEYEVFKKVAQEIDPEIEVVINYVGSWNDPAKAKELARANIDAGADIIMSVSGSGDLGVFEAINESGKDVMFLGWTGDQCSFVPDHTIASWVQLPGFLLKLAAEEYQAGTLEPGYTFYSMKDDAAMISWCNDNVPADIMKSVNDAIQQYKDGQLEIETATDI
jgi:basic membrane protein A and related proteins